MITGLEACRDRLAELLEEASAALRQASTPDALVTAARGSARALARFTVESIAENPLDNAELSAIARLDSTASAESQKLNAIAIETTVAEIAARVAQIDAIIATLNQQSLANVAESKKLRLIPVRDAIARMTDTIGAAKVLAKSLDTRDPDEAAIVAAISDLGDKLAALHSAFDTARGRN